MSPSDAPPSDSSGHLHFVLILHNLGCCVLVALLVSLTNVCMSWSFFGLASRFLFEGSGTGVVGKALLEDDEVKSFVRKYAGNSKVRGRSCLSFVAKCLLLLLLSASVLA